MPVNPSPIVENQPGTPTVAGALADIRSAIGDVRTIGDTDARLLRLLSQQTKIPFNTAGQELAKTFECKASDLPGENPDFIPAIQGCCGQVVQSCQNPIAPLVGQQNDMFSTSLDQSIQTLFGGSKLFGPGEQEFLKEIFDQTKISLRSLFLGATGNDANMMGVFVHAADSTLPAIERELECLARMKKLVRTILELCSSLPTSFIPEIPNTAVIQKLCAAEASLNAVATQLDANQTFNRPAFAAATENVCVSKDIIRSGQITVEFREYLKKRYKLSDLQVNSLLTMQFTPTPDFKLAIVKLVQVNDMLQQIDPTVIKFDTNLREFETNLRETTQTGVGDVLSLLIEVLKRQISLVRTKLEAQVETFIRLLGDTAVDRISPSLYSEVTFSRKTFDLSGETLTQTTVYAQLAALCFLMGRTQGLYDSIRQLTDGRSPVIKGLIDFTNSYKQRVCGDPNGARYIDDAVKHFVKSAEARLSGQKQTNEIITSAGKDLLARIRAHETYLGCLSDNVSRGKIDLSSLLDGFLGAIPGSGSGTYQVTNPISNLMRCLPQMKEAIKTLDVRNLCGVQKQEYNALDRLQKGLADLLTACPDPYVKDCAAEFKDRFQEQFDRRKSVAITMATFDEVPTIALEAALKQRTKELGKLIDSLLTLVNRPIEQFCRQADFGKPADTSEVLSSASSVRAEVTDQNTRNRAEEAAGVLGAETITPFQNLV